MGNCRKCGSPAGIGKNICNACWKEEMKDQSVNNLCKECNSPLGQGVDSCISCKNYIVAQLTNDIKKYSEERLITEYLNGKESAGDIKWELLNNECHSRQLMCADCNSLRGQGVENCSSCKSYFVAQLKEYNNERVVKEYQKGKESIGEIKWGLINDELKLRQVKIKPWTDQDYILLTTAPFVEGYKVVNTLEILSAESVQGMNIFRDLFAGVSDIVGGRSVTTQKALREARKDCLRELRDEAASINADAVIAIDLDYSEISGQGKSMLFLVASGTAVQLEKI